MKHPRSISCLTSLLLSLLVFAFFGPGTLSVTAAEEVLNNASIIELQSLNLGDGVVIEKIKTSKCDFDTSVTGLKQLKSAKISDAVIQAMIAAKAPAASAAPAKSANAAASGGSANSDDPAVPHTAGVWLQQGGKMIKIESEAPAETSSGGYIGPFGIGKRSQTARIPKAAAQLQLTERRPVFYFYIGRVAAVGEQIGAGEFITAQGPNEIALAQLTVRKDDKRDERMLEIGSHGAYGNSSGLDRKALRDFDAEKVAEGIYKVVPKADLADGEYAFLSIQTRGYGRFYGFGVAGKK